MKRNRLGPIWVWCTGFCALLAVSVYCWVLYIQALHNFGMANRFPTRTEFTAHLESISVTPYAVASSALLGLSFILFCQLANASGRWWGWPILFAGEILYIVVAWWVFGVESRAFEWLNLDAMSEPERLADLLSARLLGFGVGFFFLSMLWYGIQQWMRAQQSKARHTKIRNAAMEARDCPACGTEKTLRRCTAGFASGKVMECSACGHTQPIDVEGE